MKNLFLSLMLLISSMLFAQNDEDYVDGLVSEFVTSLKNRNINTYVLSKRFCNGKIEMFMLENGVMCSSKSTYYEGFLFWEDNGRLMIKKFDNCGKFYSLELVGSPVFNFIKEFKEEIQLNPVKPYKIALKESGPLKSAEIYPCSRIIKYQDEDGMQINQSYTLFDLTNGAIEKNINFEYNNSLKIVALDKVLDTLIEQMDDKFRRQ